MNVLKRIRSEKRVSQKQLADAIGVQPTCISRYELGKRKLSVDKAKQIAEFLDVSWTVLFNEDGESDQYD